MHRNEIVLVGRLSMEPVDRVLPSGSLLTQWRLAVRRPMSHPQRADALDCVTFEDDVRRAVEGWRIDDVVEVEGAVRRRWWRGGSRYEVEVRMASKVEDPIPVDGDPLDRDGHSADAEAPAESDG